MQGVHDAPPAACARRPARRIVGDAHQRVRSEASWWALGGLETARHLVPVPGSGDSGRPPMPPKR